MELDILKEMLLEEYSKLQANHIMDWVGTSQQRFDGLVTHFLANEKKLSQRAGWPMAYIAIAQPSLIEKHLPNIVAILRQPVLHDAIKRNTVRILSQIDIPENLEGEVMGHCFRLVESSEEAVAIKAFSLTVLQRLSKKYPEIIPEIKAIVAPQMHYQTAAFKVRARFCL